MYKIAIYYVYMLDIKNLLKYEGFKEMNYCEPKLKKQQMKLYRIILIYFKSLVSAGCLSLIAIFIVPLFKDVKKMPVPIYEFTALMQSPVFEIMYLWQFLGSCLLNILNIGYDCLLLSFIIFVYNQTKILKYDVRTILCRRIITNMDEQKIFEELRANIILHNRILWYSKVNLIIFYN